MGANAKTENDEQALDVGGIRIEPRANLLRHGAREIALEPKVMGVLHFLANARGEPVSRSDLLDGVWGELRGSDEALSRAVSICRRSFAELGSDNPIRTVSGRGYRIALSVRRAPLRSSDRYVPDSKSQSLYLEGRTLAARIAHPDELDSSVRLLEQTVARDPNYAEAWIALASARATFAGHTPFGDRLESIRKAGEAADRAIELMPHAPQPHTVRAQLLLAERDVCGALEAAQTAYSLDSADPDSAMWLGYIHAIIGHTQSAVPLLRQAVAADPLQGRRHMILAVALVVAGELAEAENHASMATNLGFFGAQEPYAAAAYSRGQPLIAVERFEQAQEQFRRIYDREPRFGILWGFIGKGLYGDRPLHRRALVSTAIPLAALRRNRPEGLLAHVFLRCGSADHFFMAFGDRILPGNSIVALYLWDQTSPTSAVRDAAGFEQFATQLGLVAAWEKHGPPDCRTEAWAASF